MRAAARGHPVRNSAKLFALHDGFWRWAGGKLARAHRFRLRLVRLTDPAQRMVEVGGCTMYR